MGVDFVKRNFPANSEIGKMARKVDKGLCPTCGEKINMRDFRDALSKKEYKISGMCQKCQDKIFGA